MSSTTLASDIELSADHLSFSTRVGEGGYGEVWRGTWNGVGGGITVAIKKIKVTIIEQQIKKEIRREVDILASLRHPNIVPIYGACFSDVHHELWIVMEFMDGGSLFDLLHSNVELGWEAKIRLAHHAAIGLNVLHARAEWIVHRDIKSLNYLVPKDRSTLKLTDFGMSTKVQSYTTSTVLTESEAIGTIRWSAPETLSTNKWTKKADIYSLGITLYEVASRSIPYAEFADNMRVMFQVLNSNLRPEIPTDCPEDFANIIRSCWDVDPVLRPSSLEVVDMLGKLVKKDKTTENPDERKNPPASNTLASEYFTPAEFNSSVIDDGRFAVVDNVSTLAGSDQGFCDGEGSKAKFNNMRKICYNPNDNCLYGADEMNGAIRRLTLEGVVSTVYQEGVTDGWPFRPTSVACNHKENALYAVTVLPPLICKIMPTGAKSIFVKLDIPSGGFLLNDIAIDQQTGTMYVLNIIMNAILKVTPAGEVSTFAGSADNGFADGNGGKALFSNAWGISYDHIDHCLLVCDTGNNHLRRITFNGDVTSLCKLQGICSVAVADNKRMIVTAGSQRILTITQTGSKYEPKIIAGNGKFDVVDGKAYESSFSYPYSIAIHEASHSCYVVDWQTHRIRKLSFE